jgi:hypothetical protein
MLVAFLFAPFDIIALNAPSWLPKQQFTRAGTDNRSESFVLFPGRVGWDWADILYLIASGLVTVLPIILLIVTCIHDGKRLGKDCKARESIILPAIPVAMLLMHLLGNVHYQFYCAVGVIPQQNCFWLFNWASFVASIAGLLLGAIPIGVLVGAAFLFKWLFIKTKRVAVVQPVA